jgi:DNA polymerase III subunit gamma/tau
MPAPTTPTAGKVPGAQREQTGAPAATGPRAVSAAESAVARARRLAAAAPQRSSSPAARPAPPPAHDPYDDLSPDDPDMASSGLVGAPLIAQLLGGTVIDEQVDDGRS